MDIPQVKYIEEINHEGNTERHSYTEYIRWRFNNETHKESPIIEDDCILKADMEKQLGIEKEIDKIKEHFKLIDSNKTYLIKENCLRMINLYIPELYDEIAKQFKNIVKYRLDILETVSMLANVIEIKMSAKESEKRLFQLRVITATAVVIKKKTIFMKLSNGKKYEILKEWG